MVYGDGVGIPDGAGQSANAKRRISVLRKGVRTPMQTMQSGDQSGPMAMSRPGAGLALVEEIEEGSPITDNI